MTTLITIEENEKAEASLMARSFTDKTTQSRAYINTLGAELAAKYLQSLNIKTTDRNVHSIRKVLEELDIADIILDNVRLDVRVVFDEDQIFIPKSHFEYKVTPDIYVVIKLGKIAADAEFLGFFEPKLINKNNANDDYYFIEKEKLSSIQELKNSIGNFSGRKDCPISESEMEDFEQIIVSMIDNNISTYDKQDLIQKLTESHDLRDKFIEFENFEMLSYKSVNEISEFQPELVTGTGSEFDSLDTVDIGIDGAIGALALGEVLEAEASLGDAIENFNEFDIDDIFSADSEEEFGTTEEITEEDSSDELMDLNVDELSMETSLFTEGELPEEMMGFEEIDEDDVLTGDIDSLDAAETMSFDNMPSLDEDISVVDEIPTTEEFAQETVSFEEVSEPEIAGFGSNLIESINDENEDLNIESLDEIPELDYTGENNSSDELLSEIDDLLETEEVETPTEEIIEAEFTESTEIEPKETFENDSHEPEIINYADEKLDVLFEEEPEDHDAQEEPDSLYSDIAPLENIDFESEAGYEPFPIPKKKNSTLIAAATLAVIAVSAAGISKFKNKTPELPPTGGLPPASGPEQNALPQPIEAQAPRINEDMPGSMPDMTVAPPMGSQSVERPISATPEAKKTVQPSQKLPDSYSTVEKISWEVPDSLSYSDNFKNYLRAAGKSIKLSLSSDLLLATEYPYSNTIKASITVNNNGSVKSVNITKSSGSKQIDQIVLQTVKDTLNVIKPPSNDVKGDSFNVGIIIFL